MLIVSAGNTAMLLDVGMSGTTMHFVSRALALRKKDRNNSELEQTMLLLLLLTGIIALLIVGLFVVLTGVLADFFFDKEHLGLDIFIALKWIGAYVALLFTHNFFVGVIQGYDDFKTVNIIKFFFMLFSNLGLLLLASKNAPLSQMAIWISIVAGVTLLAYIIKTFYVLKPEQLMRPTFSKRIMKEVGVYCGNTWLGFSGNILFGQMDKIVLGWVCDPKIVGIYAAIVGIATYINSIATVGLQPLITKMSELSAAFQENLSVIQKKFEESLMFNTLLIFFLGLASFPVLSFLLETVMRIQIEDPTNPLLAFKLAIIIYCVNSLYVPGFYTLMAFKETKYLGVVQLLAALTSLMLIYTVSEHYGLLGAIVANIGFIVSWSLNSMVSKKLYGKLFWWIKKIVVFLLVFLLITMLHMLLQRSFIVHIFISIAGVSGIIFLLTRAYPGMVQQLKSRFKP